MADGPDEADNDVFTLANNENHLASAINFFISLLLVLL